MSCVGFDRGEDPSRLTGLANSLDGIFDYDFHFGMSGFARMAKIG
jgi:hypothetical protein